MIKNNYLRFSLALWGIVSAGLAWAQPAPPASADQILGKTGENDASIKILKQVFGEGFVDSPLTSLGAGTDGSLLASMFVIFNICLFAVGLIWLSYTVGSGIAQTAHDGEALGKRFSSLWLPIRIVTGVAGIVPIFSGFSAFQALLMFLGLVGIGVSNWIWDETIDVTTKNFQGLTMSSAATPQPNLSLRDTYKAMFYSHACKGVYDVYSANGAQNSSSVGDSTKVAERAIAAPGDAGFQRFGFSYGTERDTALCGAWSVTTAQTPNALNSDRREDDSSAFAYRVSSVDYASIKRMSDATSQAYEAEMNAANLVMRDFANRWVTARNAYMMDSSQPEPVFPKDEIQAFATQSQARIRQRVQAATGDVSAITKTASDRMKDLGWVGAGAWFSTFAEVNAAIADSARNIEVQTSLPMSDSEQMDSYVKEAMRTLGYSVRNSEAKSSATAQQGSSSGSSIIESSQEACKFSSLETSTGNCSLGQATVDVLLTGFARDSGGAGLINPIIMFKNMGDYVLGTAAAVVGLQTAADLMPAKSVVGKVLSTFSPSNAATGALGGILKKLMETFSAMVTIVFIAGLAMAVYLPFVPFIVWIGGLVQYFTIFVEGIMSAPIWAFTHLDPNGDGMGQRTERGYLFALNMLMRPALMIMSFFIASGLMIAMGTLVAALFLPAMANVQGNSITGLFSIIGLLLVFFFINVSMIHGLFNLIFIVPDQVLNWVGGNNGVSLGRDLDDRITGVFMAGSRSVQALTGGGKDPTKGGGGAGGKGKQGDGTNATGQKPPPGGATVPR